MKTHNELRELLGAYALDAVQPDERSEIRLHVSTCLRCRHEIDRHRLTAAMLASVDDSAPGGLWERIETSLIPSDPESTADRTATADRHSLTTSWTRLVTAAAAATLAVVVGIQAARIGSLERRLDDSTTAVASLEAQLATGDFVAVVELVSDRSDVQTLTLDGQAGSALAILLPDGTGYLVSESLTRLEPDHTYQLWAIQHGEVISAALLGSDPRTMPFRVDPGTLEGLVLTAETAGGVVSSRQTPAAAWFPPGV